MAKNVLVTGGAGFIGAHACKALARAGFRPVVYDDLSTGHLEFVRWGPLVVGDVRDPWRLEETMGLYTPVAVIHFAAKSLVGESFQKLELYQSVNAGGTANVIRAMERTGCENLILSSSCAVYGEAMDQPIRETQYFDPINPYGRSKADAELVAFASDKVRTVALRYFNAAGGDPEGEVYERHNPETHLIPIVLDVAAGIRPAISIFGRDHATPDGTPIRDYIHVMDIAEAHVRAAWHLIGGSERIALNLGTGRGHSVLEVIRAAEQLTGRRIRTLDAPARAGDAKSLTADPSRAAETLAWRAVRSSLPNIIADAWSIYRDQERLAA